MTKNGPWHNNVQRTTRATITSKWIYSDPPPAIVPRTQPAAAAMAAPALDDCLCTGSSGYDAGEEATPTPPQPTSGFLTGGGGSHADRAWGYWKTLGAPKLAAAPMVDNSELPFRMLCRRCGAQVAYTPMLHSRIFSENEKYRSMEFTTCKVDKYVCCDHCFASCTILLLLLL